MEEGSGGGGGEGSREGAVTREDKARKTRADEEGGGRGQLRSGDTEETHA